MDGRQVNNVNSGRWNPRTRPAPINLNQSLPGYLLSSPSQYNPFVPSPWSPMELIHSPFNMDYQHNYPGNVFSPINSPMSPMMPSVFEEENQRNYAESVFGNSPTSPMYRNQSVFEEENQRVRSMSFSHYRNQSISSIDDTIFGKFEEKNGFRPRSKSYAEKPQTLNDSLRSSVFSPSSNNFLSRSVETNQTLNDSFRSSVFSPSSNKSLTRSSRRASNRTVSHSSEENECAYCKSINLDYHGHNKKQCPVMEQLLPCKQCGASGAENHTISHCPYSSKIILQLKPAFTARQNENIKKREIERKAEQERREYARIYGQNRLVLDNTAQ